MTFSMLVIQFSARVDMAPHPFPWLLWALLVRLCMELDKCDLLSSSGFAVGAEGTGPSYRTEEMRMPQTIVLDPDTPDGSVSMPALQLKA